jgi:hypothetical protein
MGWEFGEEERRSTFFLGRIPSLAIYVSSFLITTTREKKE